MPWSVLASVVTWADARLLRAAARIEIAPLKYGVEGGDDGDAAGAQRVVRSSLGALLQHPRRSHARAAARCRRPPSLTRHVPHFHAGRPPRNKGIRYPADPPTVEEVIAVMRAAGDAVHGRGCAR
jgi:hypothetical protein